MLTANELWQETSHRFDTWSNSSYNNKIIQEYRRIWIITMFMFQCIESLIEQLKVYDNEF